MRQRLEMRAAEEEDMMTRVPLSREQVRAETVCRLRLCLGHKETPVLVYQE